MTVKRRMFPVVMMLAAVFIRQTHPDWVKTNGPYGGNIISIAKIGTVILAGTTGGAFYSRDEADSWTEASGLDNRIVLSFTGMGTTLLAGTDDGNIFRSGDNGAAWTLSNRGIPKGISIMALEANGSRLFAAGDSGVFVSSDTGKNWSASSSGLTERRVSSLAVNEGVVFAGTAQGLFRSVDNGATWISGSSDLKGKSITCLRASAGRIYAATLLEGMFRSTGPGTEWMPVDSGISGNSITSCAVNGDRLILGASNGIFISKDAGDTWTSMNSEVCANFHAGVIFGNTIVVGSYFGVFRSSDDGATWSKAKNGIARASVSSLATSGNNIIAGTMIHGLHVSGDKGAAWKEFDLSYYYTNIISLVAGGASVFASVDLLGPFYSSNSGNSWDAMISELIPRAARFMTFHNGVLYAEASGDLFRSTDNGASWTRNSVDFYLSCLIGSGAALYAGSGRLDVHRSLDSGKTWSLIKSQNDADNTFNENIKTLAIIGDTLIAGVFAGIYRSAGDAGWMAVKSDSTGVNCFATSGRMLFAGSTHGVLLSLDNGLHWKSVNSGLGMRPVECLTVLDDFLYAGTDEGGVWRRSLAEILSSADAKNSRMARGRPAAVASVRHRDAAAIVELPLLLPGRTRITVADISGHTVATLADGDLLPGRHRFSWDSRNAAPGYYLVRIQTPAGASVKGLPLLR